MLLPVSGVLAFSVENVDFCDSSGGSFRASLPDCTLMDSAERDRKAPVSGHFGLFSTSLGSQAYLSKNTGWQNCSSSDHATSNRSGMLDKENQYVVLNQAHGSVYSGALFAGAVRRPALRSFRNRELGLGSREIGFHGGTSHTFTDVQGTKGQNLGTTLDLLRHDAGLAFGVYYRVRTIDWFGLSLGLDFASLSGKNRDNLSALYNYSFSNLLFEINARIIFFAPLPSITVFDLYGFSGFSIFTNFLSLKDQTGSKVEPDEFRMLQLALPFGIGISRRIGTRFVAGYELGYRHTAFNMLDGVSPRDTRNDAYLFNTLRFGFVLNPPR